MCQDKGLIILSGKIRNVEVNTERKRVVEIAYPWDAEREPIRKEIELNEDGSFTDTLHSESGLFHLSDHKNVVPLFLHPGAYSVEYDSETFPDGNIMLSGMDTASSYYFLDKIKNRKIVDRLNINRSEEELRSLITDKKNIELQRLEKAHLPEKFYQLERKTIEYDYLSELYFYKLYKSEQRREWRPSQKLIDELSIDYNSDVDLRENGSYSRLISYHYEDKLNELYIKEKSVNPSYSDSDHWQNRLKHYRQLTKNEFIKNYLIKYDATLFIRYSPDKERAFQDFKRYYTGNDQEFQEKIYHEYLRYTRLKPGTTSPEFFDYPNYAGGKNSLSYFKGKYVYINIWATWCGGCWSNLPYLKSLENEFSGKNIIFVGLSLDRREKEWKEAIKKYDLQSTQLLANSGDAFFKDYVVEGIPRYILLDPELKIVDFNAPSPDQYQILKELFQKLGI